MRIPLTLRAVPVPPAFAPLLSGLADGSGAERCSLSAPPPNRASAASRGLLSAAAAALSPPHAVVRFRPSPASFLPPAPFSPPRSNYLDPARELALTCQQFYNRTETRLAPEIAFFESEAIPGVEGVGVAFGDMHIKHYDAHCLLRPESVESWFVLHRVTGEERYRDWGWDFARALEKHARVGTGGYTSLDNVMAASQPGFSRDKMESFFLAVRSGAILTCWLESLPWAPADVLCLSARQETLKYLLLLFGGSDTVRAGLLWRSHGPFLVLWWS